MSNYHPVYTQIWSDHKFTELVPEAQLIFLYLITNKNCSLSGIYSVSIKEIYYSTNIPRKEVPELLKNYFDNKMLEYDFDKGIVFIKQFFKYNLGKIGNPNTIAASLLRNFELIKHDYFWQIFNKRYQAQLSNLKARVTNNRFNLNVIIESTLNPVSFQCEFTLNSVLYKDKDKDNNTSSFSSSSSSSSKKEKVEVEIPSYIEAEIWNEFLKMRKNSKKAVNSKIAITRLLKKLSTWHAKGQDVNKIIENSALAGWTNLYEASTRTIQKPMTNYEKNKAVIQASRQRRQKVNPNSIKNVN